MRESLTAIYSVHVNLIHCAVFARLLDLLPRKRKSLSTISPIMCVEVSSLMKFPHNFFITRTCLAYHLSHRFSAQIHHLDSGIRMFAPLNYKTLLKAAYDPSRIFEVCYHLCFSCFVCVLKELM